MRREAQVASAIAPVAVGLPVTPRYAALDALRGVCALCVCLFHFKVNSPIASWSFIHGSWLFVDFFFVLSGFVIALNYRDRLAAGMPVGNFAILRLGRVYPLHIVMLAAFVAMEVAGLYLAGKGMMLRQPFDAHHSIVAIFTNLTLFQSFGIHDVLTWNHPSWSIATEFWTYLLFALACRWAGAALDRWLAAAALAAALFLFLHGENGINVTYDWGMVRCIYGFAVGVMLARWRPLPAPSATGSGLATLGEVATAALVIAFVALLGHSRINVTAPLVFAAAVLVFARQAGAISRLLLTWPLQSLGLWSYSIYMVHVFVQSRFDDVLKIAGRFGHVRLVTPARGPTGAPFDLVGATPCRERCSPG